MAFIRCSRTTAVTFSQRTGDRHGQQECIEWILSLQRANVLEHLPSDIEVVGYRGDTAMFPSPRSSPMRGPRSRGARRRGLAELQPRARYMNPRFADGKFARFGKIVLIWVVLSPIQLARVAPIWSIARVGIIWPREKLSGPFRTMLGQVP